VLLSVGIVSEGTLSAGGKTLADSLRAPGAQSVWT